MKDNGHGHGSEHTHESVAHANKAEMHKKPRKDQFPKASDMKPDGEAEKIDGDCEKASEKK
jgi:hypothetical protein